MSKLLMTIELPKNRIPIRHKSPLDEGLQALTMVSHQAEFEENFRPYITKTSLRLLYMGQRAQQLTHQPGRLTRLSGEMRPP